MSRRSVLIADRSAAIRSVLHRRIEADDGLRVVAEATNATEVIELISRWQPDAVVMDVDLPELGQVKDADGVFGPGGPPIVVVTSSRDPARSNAAFRALRRKIVGVLGKPTVPSGWESFGDTLCEILRQVERDDRGRKAPARALPDIEHQAIRCVAIGASTGGPAALAELLQMLDRSFQAAIVVVQHIAAGFEVALASWLASESSLDVKVATHGEALTGGKVRLAPAGAHLTVEPNFVLRHDRRTPPTSGHRPSADVLFRSMLGRDPRAVAAVLLSGMGSDGVAGMVELRRAGALTLVQDESSSAVWGMPRAAIESDAAELALSPAEMAALLRRLSADDLE